eukprot:TRINITY_DN35_c0_g2_i2.p1 TRINITY_DN35_c0_g2~~TRINITY_DN35_c0_g2_i2.p1  ORF type:complete len:161 (-),score=22.05 TRINITY_DN35_c0_g2_i2:128-610(-)
MVVLSFRDEIVSPVAAARFYKAIVVDATNLFPKIWPHFVLSAAIIEGDGGSGSVKEFHFSEAAGVYTHAKELHYLIDEEKMENNWTWIEGGDMGTKLKSYDVRSKYVPTSNGGCIFKFEADYEPIDGVDYFEGMKIDRDFLREGFKIIEEYLLANPEAYA